MRRLLPLILALVIVPPAAAAKFTFTVLSTSPANTGITLNGDDQTSTFAIVTEVAYTNGGNTTGWKIQAAAGVPTFGSQTLPALVVTGGSFACASGCQTNPAPLNVSYPITLSSTAQTVYNANVNTGQGTYDITNTYQVTYPASTVAGTYTTTVTLTGATGPT
jgi:hypothetical protein